MNKKGADLVFGWMFWAIVFLVGVGMFLYIGPAKADEVFDAAEDITKCETLLRGGICKNVQEEGCVPAKSLCGDAGKWCCESKEESAQTILSPQENFPNLRTALIECKDNSQGSCLEAKSIVEQITRSNAKLVFSTETIETSVSLWENAAEKETFDLGFSVSPCYESDRDIQDSFDIGDTFDADDSIEFINTNEFTLRKTMEFAVTLEASDNYKFLRFEYVIVPPRTGELCAVVENE